MTWVSLDTNIAPATIGISNVARLDQCLERVHVSAGEVVTDLEQLDDGDTVIFHRFRVRCRETGRYSQLMIPLSVEGNQWRFDHASCGDSFPNEAIRAAINKIALRPHRYVVTR